MPCGCAGLVGGRPWRCRVVCRSVYVLWRPQCVVLVTVDDVALDQAFADQLVAAIAFLHEMKLTHTDLKPENILLTTREFSPSTARTARRVPMNIVAPSSTKVKRTCCVCVLWGVRESSVAVGGWLC